MSNKLCIVCSKPVQSARASYCSNKCRSKKKYEYSVEYRLRTLYNMTLDDYNSILEEQGGVCAICETKPKRAKLAVDHNHVTGHIRGLLCKICNHRLLGGAKENADILRRAADYLENPPAQYRGLISADYLAK